jgi:hypothetical protein
MQIRRRTGQRRWWTGHPSLPFKPRPALTPFEVASPATVRSKTSPQFPGTRPALVSSEDQPTVTAGQVNVAPRPPVGVFGRDGQEDASARPVWLPSPCRQQKATAPDRGGQYPARDRLASGSAAGIKGPGLRDPEGARTFDAAGIGPPLVMEV